MNSTIHELLRTPSPIVTINGGSSSIKFAIFDASATLVRMLHGKLDRIGLCDTSFEFHDVDRNATTKQSIQIESYEAATHWLIDWLESRLDLKSAAAIGHRLVHGMQHTESALITAELLEDLQRIVACAPHHLPGELALIRSFRARYPQLLQFACFDTGFHATMPRVATLFALPRRYDRQGVRRYGFHGLSYAYMMRELQRLGDGAATRDA